MSPPLESFNVFEEIFSRGEARSSTSVSGSRHPPPTDPPPAPESAISDSGCATDPKLCLCFEDSPPPTGRPTDPPTTLSTDGRASQPGPDRPTDRPTARPGGDAETDLNFAFENVWLGSDFPGCLSRLCSHVRYLCTHPGQLLASNGPTPPPSRWPGLLERLRRLTPNSLLRHV